MSSYNIGCHLSCHFGCQLLMDIQGFSLLDINSHILGWDSNPEANLNASSYYKHMKGG